MDFSRQPPFYFFLQAYRRQSLDFILPDGVTIATSKPIIFTISK